MRKILSICSFNRRYSAFLLALLLIGAVELTVGLLLPAMRFSHEVDAVLYQVKSKPMEADYVLVGDSVGRQILQHFENDEQFAMLATNQAIEMTGQFFMVKRYLQNNPPPRAVIFSGLPTFLNQNLDQIYTENYVLRTFNEFDETWELLKVKRDLTQTAKALLYKLFPSFKYRLHLQNSILDITNANIYTGVGETAVVTVPEKYSMGRILQRFEGQGVGRYHFRQLVEMLSGRGIVFCYIPVPIMQRNGTHDPFLQSYQKLFKLLRAWQDEGLSILFDENIPRYSQEMFRDAVHFNKDGELKVQAYINDRVKHLIVEVQGDQ